MRAIPAVLVLAISSTHAWAQCGGWWDSGGGVPGVQGLVNAAAVWDPDGPGPRDPVLVLGGAFLLAGDAPAAHLATWDPATGAWASLATVASSQPYPQVRSLLVTSDGQLLVGGDFEAIDGVAASSIAKYDGRAWSSLGAGINRDGNHTVYAMSEAPDGAIVVGGAFRGAGNVDSLNLVKWNGAGWEGYSGVTLGWVPALAHVPEVGLVVGGAGLFRESAGVLRPMAVVGSPPFTTVSALHVMPGGDLIVGGEFVSIGGVSALCVARWSRGAWSAMGSGADLSGVRCITSTSDGDVWIGGAFLQAGGGTAVHAARWDGLTWRPLAGGLPGESVNALAALPDGRVFAGGRFADPGPAVLNAALWDGAVWRSLGAGHGGVTDGEVYALHELVDESWIVGGAFRTMRGAPAAGLARFADGVWSEVGGGLNAPPYAMAPDGDGGLYVGGAFTAAGGAPLNRVGRWDGRVWHSLGVGLNGAGGVVRALVRLPGGDVAAIGESLRSAGSDLRGVARWNGVAWSTIGGGLANLQGELAPQAAVVLPNGRLVVGGRFNRAGGTAVEGLAQWDGQRWSSVGAGLNAGAEVYALAVLTGGDLAVGGYFNTAGGAPARNIARWDGSAWAPLAEGRVGLVRAIVPLQAGGLMVGSEVPAAARWDGVRWTTVGGGLDSIVRAGRELPDGSVLLGGAFMTWGADQISNPQTGWRGGRGATPFLARWHPCPSEFDCLAGLTAGDYETYVEAFETGGRGADFNEDGFVDFFDYDAFVRGFEQGC